MTNNTLDTRTAFHALAEANGWARSTEADTDTFTRSFADSTVLPAVEVHWSSEHRIHVALRNRVTVRGTQLDTIETAYDQYTWSERHDAVARWLEHPFAAA